MNPPPILLGLLSLSLLGTAPAALNWTQVGGVSGTSGAGAHINTFIDTPSGSNGSANFIPVGTVMSYGSVSDGTYTVDYAVKFAGANNPMHTRSVNNSFTIHADGTADFYTESNGNRGRDPNTQTFADNGNAGIEFCFFEQGTYNPITNDGCGMLVRMGLGAVNNQPNIYTGGQSVARLNTNEFYDVYYNPLNFGGTVETDPSGQIVTYDNSSAVGLTADGTTNTLVNYSTAPQNPTGSTGPTDPGTGGFVDPLTGDVRLEFDVTHDVSDADWDFLLPYQPSYQIWRAGDPGQRSGIGFIGEFGVPVKVPEPSRALLMLSALFAMGLRRRR